MDMRWHCQSIQVASSLTEPRLSTAAWRVVNMSFAFFFVKVNLNLKGLGEAKSLASSHCIFFFRGTERLHVVNIKSTRLHVRCMPRECVLCLPSVSCVMKEGALSLFRLCPSSQRAAAFTFFQHVSASTVL